jgi:uncharacterized protein DUF4440
MKSCPTCKRSFADDSLTYCLDDGTPLVSESLPPENEETIVTPSAGASSELPPTQYGQLPGKATVSGNVSDFQIPSTPPYSPVPQKRRMWPWIVAGLAVLLFFMIVIGLVIAIPKIVGNSSGVGGITRPGPSVNPSVSPSNTSTPTSSDNAAPTDEAVVLSQLTDLEEQWTEANVKGDKEAIQRILADDYSGGEPAHTKEEYLQDLKPDPTVNSWELQDLRVDLGGDRATVNGYLRQETTRGPEVYGFTDVFAWRDGRWQAVGSRASRVK